MDESSRPSRPLTLFAHDSFQSEEERHAWEYCMLPHTQQTPERVGHGTYIYISDMRLVSSNVPALDGPDNPYRQLSFTALSSPVLLKTIVCIATEHMLNFGLGNVPTAAQRQQQMLHTIGQDLQRIDKAGTRETRGVAAAASSLEHEALLTAVVLQGVVVAQSEDGVLEPHVRCASFLMETLDLFRQVPHSALARMAIQRFAMVDVMLAISRQRRPYAPSSFVLHQPDPGRWDNTEPSFHKMTGCPQPLMCLLVRISHLACDVEERLAQSAQINDLLTRAYGLESDLRAWGTDYIRYSPGMHERQPLDILTECFYWTAHLLLARRVFRDPTRSARVQHLTKSCFGLMDQLSTGCGPDSSLPQPFYLAAREAVSLEDRAWVRQKHQSMTEYYREQQRNMAMRLTERVWEITDEGQLNMSSQTQFDPPLRTADGQIRDLDQQTCLFIF